MVAGNAVLDGADNCHRSDADGQGCRHEPVHKSFFPGISGLDLQPLSELLDPMFQIDPLPQQRADGIADDNHHRPAAFQTVGCDRHHLLHRTADAHKQDADADGLHQCLLIPGTDRLAEHKADQSAHNNTLPVTQNRLEASRRFCV